MLRPTFLRLLAGLLLAVLLSSCGAYTFHTTAFNPPEAAPDLSLTDQSGRPFRLSEQRGAVVLVFFGFTSCPDVCPTALADLASVRRKLGADAERVRVAMVTVDPARDTPETLQRYVTRFDPTFIGLTGTPEQLAATNKAYGVTAIRRDLPGSALKYTIDHSAYVYVIDRAGRWRALFRPGDTVDDMASDLRFLANEAVER
jgi:protein SCO1/2